MKSYRYASLFAVLLFIVLPARAQQHFDECISRTAENATLIIPASIEPTAGGQPLAAGDEIAVVTPDGVCAGVTVWSGGTTAISAWGADEYSGVGGFEHGDRLRFVVWDASEEVEYQDIAVTYSSRESYFRTDGLYAGGAIYELAALNTVLAPQLDAPTDGASVGASSVALEWLPVQHADTYVLQVAKTPTFDELVVDETSISETSFTMGELAPGVTYYWRVGTTSGDGVIFSSTWQFQTAHAQDIVLEPGWNLISSYIRPGNESLSDLIDPLGNNVVLVKDERARVYIPGYGTDEIGSWTAERGYKVYVREQDTLSVAGALLSPEETPVEIRAGWNLVGYLPQVELETAGALASVERHLVLAKDIDGRVYYPQFGIEDLDTLRPGRGYAIYAREDATLTYPSSAHTVGKTSSAGSAPASMQAGAVADDADSLGVGYSAHIIVDRSELDEGAVISVWSDDTLVGQGTVQDSSALILVRGDDPLTDERLEGAGAGQPLVMRYGTTRQSPRLAVASAKDMLTGRDREDLTFAEDAVWEVTVAEATDASSEPGVSAFSLDQNYPNPFRQSTTISYVLDRTNHVQLEVYNLVGQRVKVLVSETQTAGHHDVTFDAESLPSGTYVYRLDAGGKVSTKSMIMLR